MKAIVCTQWGPPEALVVTELPSPHAGPGEVVVRVKAAGVSFPEALKVQGKYQVKPPLPYVPGREIAGIVVEVGAGVTRFHEGDAVFGRAEAGGFAEEARAGVDALWPLPAGMAWDVAASFVQNYATSHYALADVAALRPGETLLVLGAAGGVGLAAVEIGRMLGARVVACASSPERLAVCARYGADATIDYETEDLREAVRRHTGGKGVDVVFDAVGDRFAEPAVRSLRYKGRYLVVGFAAGQVPRVALNLLLLKESSLVGIYLGLTMKEDPPRAKRAFDEVVSLVASGRLKPCVSARYPLARAGEAFADLLGRRVVGKAVVVP